jgi:Na+-driven multidrug efflux pump/anti-sigma regulatory factor (Ser/Thr protein kinase)
MHLLIPAMISMMGEYVLILSDNMIAGRMINEKALSAISLCQPYFSVVVFFNSLLLLGTAILTSEAVGAGDRNKANKYFGQGIILSLGVGMIFTLGSIIFESWIFSMFNIPADTYAFTEQYFSWLRYYPLFSFYFVMFTAVMNDGGGKWCNRSSVVMILSNILLSIVFCHFFGMKGISMGTILSLVIASVVLCFQFLEKNNPLKFVFYFNWKDVLKVLKYGSADSFFYLFIGLLYLFFNWYLLKYFNSNAVVVFTLLMNVETLLITGYDGISQALQPNIAIYQGEGNQIGIHKTMHITYVLSTILAVPFIILMISVANFIPGMFGVTDPSIASMSILAIRIFLSTSIFLVWGLLLSSYVLYIGKIFFSLLTLSFIILVFTVPLTLFMGVEFGFAAIWIAYSISAALGLTAGLFVIYRVAKRSGTTFPWLLDENVLKNQVSFDILAKEENVRVIMDKVENELKRRGFEEKKILKILLILEETIMLNLDREKKRKKYYVECTLIFKGEITMIIRDNGLYSDPTDANAMPESLRQYLSTMIVSQQKGVRYSSTIGNNRVIFKF